jgi:site-specific DNA recombinase
VASETILKKALAFVVDLQQAYLEADPLLRRLMNQALFERLLVDDQECVTGDLADPFDLLIKASRTDSRVGEKSPEDPEGPTRGPQGSNNEDLVPPGGLEPPTHGLGNRCSIP